MGPAGINPLGLANHSVEQARGEPSSFTQHSIPLASNPAATQRLLEFASTLHQVNRDGMAHADGVREPKNRFIHKGLSRAGGQTPAFFMAF
jgi:hypothetical protein